MGGAGAGESTYADMVAAGKRGTLGGMRAETPLIRAGLSRDAPGGDSTPCLTRPIPTPPLKFVAASTDARPARIPPSPSAFAPAATSPASAHASPIASSHSRHLTAPAVYNNGVTSKFEPVLCRARPTPTARAPRGSPTDAVLPRMLCSPSAWRHCLIHSSSGGYSRQLELPACAL